MLQERQVKDDLIEIGLLCPDCADWTHAHFTNTALKTKQERLAVQIERYQERRTEAQWRQVQTMQSAYRNEFDAFNRRWRQKLGMMVKV